MEESEWERKVNRLMSDVVMAIKEYEKSKDSIEMQIAAKNITPGWHMDSLKQRIFCLLQH
jgi:hypothetical protein